MTGPVNRRWKTLLVVAVLGLGGLASGRLLAACERGSGSSDRGAAADVPPTGAGVSVPVGPPSPEQALGDGGAYPSSEVRGSPGLGPPPRVIPRAAGEWQGMLVDVTFPQVCSRSSQCGLALACKSNGFCGACASDSDCAAGEKCVLDRCLLASNVSCRTHADCPEGNLCILSGFTPGGRANRDMRSYCNPSWGGTKQVVQSSNPDAANWDPAPPLPVSAEKLRDSLHR